MNDIFKFKVKINQLKIGSKVHYQPDHYGDDKWENGIVKEIPDFAFDENSPIGFNSVRVVYNCGDNWEKYQNYTSALTNVRDLYRGWKHKNIEDLKQ